MIGALNNTCDWSKREKTNKYNESTYAPAVSMPCSKGIDTRMVQTDVGLVKTEVHYFILHTDVVKDGDLLDGFKVAVSEYKDLGGRTAFYKAVVVNG